MDPDSMTDFARQVLRTRHVPLRLVIFDCDGVLVDSEPVANRVVAAELLQAGRHWVTASRVSNMQARKGVCPRNPGSQ